MDQEFSAHQFKPTLTARLIVNAIWIGLLLINLLAFLILNLVTTSDRVAFLRMILRNWLIYALIAGPVVLLVSLRKLDLSIGGLIAFVVIIAAMNINQGGLFRALLIVIPLALIWGLLVGLLVSLGRVQSAILTLAGGYLLQSAANYLRQSAANYPGDMRGIALQEPFGFDSVYILIPLVILSMGLSAVFILFGEAGPLALHKKPGAILQRLFHQGLPYLFTALFAAIAALGLLSRYKHASPDTGINMSWEFLFIVIIGGVPLIKTPLNLRYANLLGAYLGTLTFLLLRDYFVFISILHANSYFFELVVAATFVGYIISSTVFYKLAEWIVKATHRRVPPPMPQVEDG